MADYKKEIFINEEKSPSTTQSTSDNLVKHSLIKLDNTFKKQGVKQSEKNVESIQFFRELYENLPQYNDSKLKLGKNKQFNLYCFDIDGVILQPLKLKEKKDKEYTVMNPAFKGWLKQIKREDPSAKFLFISSMSLRGLSELLPSDGVEPPCPYEANRVKLFFSLIKEGLIHGVLSENDLYYNDGKLNLDLNEQVPILGFFTEIYLKIMQKLYDEHGKIKISLSQEELAEMSDAVNRIKEQEKLVKSREDVQVLKNAGYKIFSNVIHKICSSETTSNSKKNVKNNIKDIVTIHQNQISKGNNFQKM